MSYICGLIKNNDFGELRSTDTGSASIKTAFKNIIKIINSLNFWIL